MTVPRLHVVTSGVILAGPDFRPRALALLEAHGPRLALHLRGHGTTAAELYALAAALAGPAADAAAMLLVNGRLDLALALGCGAQLGRRSVPLADARRLLGPRAPLGYSAHSAAEAASAGVDGADFVLLGTIWATPSHPDVEPAGLGVVTEAASRAAIPVVAIGGVTPVRVGAALDAGAHGVAAVSGVWSAADPVAVAGYYLEELSAVRR